MVDLPEIIWKKVGAVAKRDDDEATHRAVQPPKETPLTVESLQKQRAEVQEQRKQQIGYLVSKTSPIKEQMHHYNQRMGTYDQIMNRHVDVLTAIEELLPFAFSLSYVLFGIDPNSKPQQAPQ